MKINVVLFLFGKENTSNENRGGPESLAFNTADNLYRVAQHTMSCTVYLKSYKTDQSFRNVCFKLFLFSKAKKLRQQKNESSTNHFKYRPITAFEKHVYTKILNNPSCLRSTARNRKESKTKLLVIYPIAWCGFEYRDR